MQNNTETKPEVLAVFDRYARRGSGSLYSILRPEVLLSTQEWQREMLLFLGRDLGFTDVDLSRLQLVDVGCGYGGHLLDFMRFGFKPQNLYGIELIPERVAGARAKLPDSLHIHVGDASTATIAAIFGRGSVQAVASSGTTSFTATRRTQTFGLCRLLG
jgi:SAM-dependent methyltransferase